MTQVESGIAEAIRTAGSQEKLGREIGAHQQAVSKWLKRGWVPASRAVEIEALTGVPRARLLRPSLVDLVDSGSGL